MVWTAGSPLQVPLLVVPPGVETSSERDSFPDQVSIEQDLDIFLRSMRRHFPYRPGESSP